MRAFVAIDLPEPVRDSLDPVLDALAFARTADPEQLHLTLAFLGERPDAEVEAAHWALDALAPPAFGMRLTGLDTFQGAEGLTVWAGIADPAPLRDLHARVLSALHRAGIVLERRRFRPHVTLARLPRPGPPEHERLARVLGRWAAFPSPAWEVESFGLWRSTLRKAGAVHDELARYPLRVGGARGRI